MNTNRREFLWQAAITAGAVSMSGIMSNQASAGEETPKSTEMIYRPLGRTGERVSVIGLGGFHIGIQRDEQESLRIIRSAIDRGINFMDNCWDYNDGGSELRMGKALRDGYREKVFLMTKIDGRTKAAAAKQINQSLQRLGADHIDLMQIHEVIRLEDPDRCFAANGCVEALVAAQKTGKIRFIGFTGHKDPIVHVRMLEIAAQHNFRFDAVQMPLNVMDAHFRSFEHQVLPVLVKQQIGVLGMKPMASGFILKSNAVTPIECLQYAMNLPTSTVITGIDRPQLVDQAIEAVRTFKPLSNEQVTALLKKTAQAGAQGQFEPFKTNNIFDGTAHNPQWLG